MSEQRRWAFARGARMVVGAIFGLSLGGILLVAGPTLAQRKALDRANETGQMGASSAAVRQTDAPHAFLLKLTGHYDRVIKFLGQTGATAAPSSGTCTISAVLGGKFIVEKSHDVVFGRAVDGLRIYGYNGATKQYEMARMYTMSNAITLMKGTSSDGGKTIDFTGETGTSGMKTMPLRAHFQQMDEDRFSVTMSTVGADGKDVPFQETDYTRKK